LVRESVKGAGMAIGRRSFVRRILLALGGATGSPAILKPASNDRAAQQAGSGGRQPSAENSAGEKSSASFILPGKIEVIRQSFELIVVGGGISGVCAAISAARNGVKVALVHERSTLGGNSSSEVRLYPEDTCTFSPWIKESGILEEITAEERVRNWEPSIEGLMNSNWDLVLYEWVRRERNLTLFLNSTMREVAMRDTSHIDSIRVIQLGTEREFLLSAPLFIDASGDGVLGFRAGADFSWGPEVRAQYQEQLAPAEPSHALMGNTLFFRARDTGRPIPFKRPDWVASFDAESDLTGRSHGFIEGGYWWIEVGAPFHPIRDNEQIRDEALRQLLGVWDHIKNKCADESIRDRAKTYALEFVGFWPYKRESRRILGDYILTERDVLNPATHSDDIAYGVWGIDIHVSGGINARRSEPYPYPQGDKNFSKRGTIPYGIPLRSCYSRNIHNLLTAGRPIGTSYVAFASSRVLPTGAIVGQGVGVAAALCMRYNCEPAQISSKYSDELQQTLLRQDASIPGVENTDPRDLARKAQVRSSSEASMQFPESEVFHPAQLALGQVFPVTTGSLDSIELKLRSKADQPREVVLRLRRVEHVWDLRPTPDIASARVMVPPGHEGYVSFPLHATTSPHHLYFAYLDPQPEIEWALYTGIAGEPSLVPVGATPADLPPGDRWRPLTDDRAFVMKVQPEQRPYGPSNVNTGTNRPDRWPNIYVSDPDQSLPAWLELRFPSPVRVNRIHITFDTDTNRRVTLPTFRYPECVKRYEVAILKNGQWQTVVEEHDNYFRSRVHRFAPTYASGIRLNLLEKQARVYEVRVYDEDEASRAT
jgi:hypothetical protein